MNVEDLLKAIKNNNISGASELMIKAIECIRAFSESFDAANPRTYYELMIDVGRQLIDAQISMATIFNAVNNVLMEVEKELEKRGTVAELKNAVKSASEHLLANSKNALIKIQRHSSAIIEDECTILTHSYSSTVIKSLILAHQEGKDIDVIVTESRPLFEGRRAARILGESGIKVVLITDMASFHFLNDIDLILTGSDCICYNGVVNKIGTKGIAIAASHHSIPFYVLSERSKFLPLKYMDKPQIEDKEPREVLEEEGGDIEVRNIYFDITPHKFFKGIITEDGVMSVDEVQALLASLEVSKGLVGWIEAM